MISIFIIFLVIFSTNLLIYILLKNSKELIYFLLIHNLGYFFTFLFAYLILQDWVEAEKIDFNASTFQLFGNTLANLVLAFCLVMTLSPFIYKLMKKMNKDR